MTLASPVTIAIAILTLVTVAYGGTFMLRVVNGRQPANELQRTYFRAGHAHAGMFVTLGIVLQILMSADGVPEWGPAAASFVLWAAVLMPAGFFLSVIGRDPQQPNGLKLLIPLGALSLAGGLVAAGIALLVASGRA